VSTQAERDFIKPRADNYRRALARAALAIHAEPKFTGARKLREALAHQAALKAIGFPGGKFTMPKGCGDGTPETEQLVAALFERAVADARFAVRP
jgi:hypothetical protein